MISIHTDIYMICIVMLCMFYQSIIASVIFFAAVCWGNNIRVKDRTRLDKLIKKLSSVLGVKREWRLWLSGGWGAS